MGPASPIIGRLWPLQGGVGTCLDEGPDDGAYRGEPQMCQL